MTSWLVLRCCDVVSYKNKSVKPWDIWNRDFQTNYVIRALFQRPFHDVYRYTLQHFCCPSNVVAVRLQQHSAVFLFDAAFWVERTPCFWWSTWIMPLDDVGLVSSSQTLSVEIVIFIARWVCELSGEKLVKIKPASPFLRKPLFQPSSVSPTGFDLFQTMRKYKYIVHVSGKRSRLFHYGYVLYRIVDCPEGNESEKLIS